MYTLNLKIISLIKSIENYYNLCIKVWIRIKLKKL